MSRFAQFATYEYTIKTRFCQPFPGPSGPDSLDELRVVYYYVYIRHQVGERDVPVAVSLA